MPPKSQIIQITKAELAEVIQQEITAANQQQSKDLKAIFDAQLSDLTKKHTELEQRTVNLEKEKDDLKAQVVNLQTEVQNLKDNLKGHSSQINDCIKWSNKNEQYSRRNNIKIHGLALKDNEDCRVAVSNMLRDKLKLHIKDGDIAAAHVVPRRQKPGTVDANQAGEDGEARPPPPPPIIVRFFLAARDTRDEAIKRRKQLIGSHMAIYDDITTLNAKLLNRLKNDGRIKSAWSWMGKIYAENVGGKVVKFEPFDDIATKFNA